MNNDEKVLNELLSFREKLDFLIDNQKNEIIKKNTLLVPSAKSKKQKTVMLTAEQINKVKKAAEMSNMNFSETLGYIIDNITYGKNND